MARNLVIDADGHCYEPDSELAKWMPKELAHLAPNRVADSSGYSHLLIEGRLAADERSGGSPSPSGRGRVGASRLGEGYAPSSDPTFPLTPTLSPPRVREAPPRPLSPAAGQPRSPKEVA